MELNSQQMNQVGNAIPRRWVEQKSPKDRGSTTQHTTAGRSTLGLGPDKLFSSKVLPPTGQGMSLPLLRSSTLPRVIPNQLQTLGRTAQSTNQAMILSYSKLSNGPLLPSAVAVPNLSGRKTLFKHLKISEPPPTHTHTHAMALTSVD